LPLEYSKEVKDKNVKRKNTGQKSKSFHFALSFWFFIFDF